MSDHANLSTSTWVHVLDLPPVKHLVFPSLDVASIDALLTVLAQAISPLELPSITTLHDAELWHQLTLLHFQAPRPDELAVLSLPDVPRGWAWTDDQLACPELQAFLRSADERTAFDHIVRIVRGNIARMHEIDGTLLDGIAFPTSAYLQNFFTGAAGAMFQRAGPDLTTFVRERSFRHRRGVGECVATPAFAAGVRRLVHCVGPRLSHEHCFEMLARTYENMMNVMLQEDLTCVACASISTGNMSVPVAPAARVALRAIAMFIRTNHWNGKLAVVCFDEAVFKAFESAREEVLATFNAPQEFPSVTPDMWN